MVSSAKTQLQNASTPASILNLIDNTPLINIKQFNSTLQANLFVKCEMMNPSLSIKDRIVLAMIRDYEQKGVLKPGVRIYEASTGNAGSALAMICAVLGYQAVITMPDKTSLEKINTMKAFGAKVIICKKAEPDSPEHYNNKAEILSKADKGSLFF